MPIWTNAPRLVVYRATDFRSNEFRGLRGGETYEPVEHNPMIGYRGCYRYIKEPDLFALELEALARVREQSVGAEPGTAPPIDVECRGRLKPGDTIQFD